MNTQATTGPIESTKKDEGDDDHVVDSGGRPNFCAFAKALRGEARFSADLHGDESGGDQAALQRLADEVEQVGKRLGYM